MLGLPAILNVAGRRCLIVGGGSVALRRARALLEAGAVVVVVAPRVDEQLAVLELTVERRPFEPDDLKEAFLAVAATDSRAVNAQVAAEARSRRVLVNRTDEPDAGDMVVPAHRREGPITVAVDTGGASAKAAAALRDALLERLDPDWPRLLTLVAPYRGQIQEAFSEAEERRRRLLALTGTAAMAALKKGGEEALTRFCQQLLQPDAGVPNDTEEGSDADA